MKRNIWIVSILGAFFAGSALAGTQCATDPNLEIRGGQAFFQVQRVTNYEPQRGGTNGRCGRSATRGVNACRHFLDDHVRGQADSAVGAVPQRGGNSFMFGGVFHAVSLEKEGVNSPTGCVYVSMADHYGRGSDFRYKVDIVTRAHSRLADEVNNSGVLDYRGRYTGNSGMFELVGAVSNLRSVNGSRRIQRNPDAI